MEEKKIKFKDLNGWLKFGIVGGILYFLIMILGFTIGFFSVFYDIFIG